jgi:Ca-activated chloride channel family protein
VIEFNSYAQRLYGTRGRTTPENVERAVRWVRGCCAQGGTEMARALDLALDGPARRRLASARSCSSPTARSANEDYLLAMIRERLGDSRLFTVGIGSAPNSHFMTKAAQFAPAPSPISAASTR